MRVDKKRMLQGTNGNRCIKLTLTILLVLTILPYVSGLSINDTTFFSSETNYTIFVDNIILDQVTVENITIEFFNLTSLGSNFINTNATYDAVANFIGLDISLTILNVNTSVNLFTSTLGNQNFNATFTSGQVLRIIPYVTTTTDIQTACNDISRGVAGFYTTIPTFFILLSIVVIILIVVGIITIVKDTSKLDSLINNISEVSIPMIITTVLSIVILGIIFLIIAGALCGAT